MKTKTEVQDLRIGMYVVELDRPWLNSPFMFQGFEIHTDEELEQLRKYCHYVYILEKEEIKATIRKPVRKPVSKPDRAPKAYTIWQETAATAPNKTTGKKIRLAEAPPARYQDRHSVEEEIPRAAEIEKKAREMLYTILDDARFGHSVDTPGARKLVGQMTESIIHNPDALVWLTHLKQKSEYTALHSLRVCVLALAFGRHLGYEPDKLAILGTGALLHDIGKLKVPEEILDKPAPLTPEEFEIVKSHVPSGLKILEGAHGISPAVLEIVGRHHERYSGNGYVLGINGDAIGEFGMVGAIVDVYDAITSDRSYHMGASSAEALKILYEGRQNAYHPWLVEQFIQCLGIFPIGSIVELSTGSIGVVVTTNRTRRLRPRVAVILSPDKKPYQKPTYIDLMQVTRDTSGQLIEIKTILPAGSYEIKPTDHIPPYRVTGRSRN